MRRLISVAVAIAVFAGTLHGQQITLDNPGNDPAGEVLREVVARGQYLVLDRDTLIGPDEVIPGDVVVAGSRVTLQGRITGAVVVLQGDFFVRPQASVGGAIAVLGWGGAYVSGLATAPTPVYSDLRARTEVSSTGQGIAVRIVPPPPPSVFHLPNLIGLDLPTYDRADGLSLSWGPELRFGGRDTATLSIRPVVGYRFARERVTGGVDVRLRTSARSMITLRASRATRTPDAWIRGDLPNTFSSLLVQSDTRDYFESDEVSLTIARTPPPPLIQGEGFIAPAITLRASRDRSLVASNPWSLFDDEEGWRENPRIDDGEVVSVVASALAGWQGATARFSGAIAVEWAPDGLGDFDFAQFTASASWSSLALWNHELAVTGFVMLPLGGGEAPLQRWSHVGGSGTLPTFPDAAMRGDHVVFVESIYLIPLDRVLLPLVGSPALRFEHAAGAAWRTGDAVPDLGQNAGAGIQVQLFHAVLVTDPSVRPLSLKLRLGAQVPFGSSSGGRLGPF